MNPYRAANSSYGVSSSPSMYQQLPYNPQNFYQMEMAKQFKSHMEFMNGNRFKFDTNGKLLLNQFQCSKCLKLCEFENVLLIHFESCEQFACKYLECQNKFYTAIYVANENFNSNDELEEHVKEKHINVLSNDQNIMESEDVKLKSNSGILIDLDQNFNLNNVGKIQNNELEKVNKDISDDVTLAFDNMSIISNKNNEKKSLEKDLLDKIEKT